MFETFVKEKSALLGYVNDLIRFAAKLQDIDLKAAKVFDEQSLTEEEHKGGADVTSRI